MLSTELRNKKLRFMMSMMNIVLLGCHTLLLFFFFFSKIYLMVYVNINSVILYIVLLVLHKTNHVSTSASTWFTTIEILVHLVFVLVCLGWDCGFQLYCIGLLSTLFFTSYGSEQNDAQIFHPVQSSIFSMVIFFGMEYYTSVHAPLYPVSPFTQKFLYTVNALLIFLIVIVFSKGYSDVIRSSEQTIRREANLDELTKLYNRRKMREILGRVHESMVQTGTHYCIAMFDIDDFKKINDTYGHAAGDYVLVTIGRIFGVYSSETVNACRWGGEEFLLVEPYTTDNFECIEHIEGIRKDVESYPFVYNGRQFSITVTAGMACSSGRISIAKVIAQADENLYLGKTSGKNQIMMA